MSGARARQQLKKHIEISKARYYLLDPHHGDVNARQTRRQTNVAFVLDDHDRAGFSDREVYAADANVGSGEAIAQLRNIAQLRKNAGYEVPELEDLAPGGKIEQGLYDVERRLREAYRLYGHLFPDPEVAEDAAAKRRAQVVADKLMSNGVAAARFSTKGMGETNLKVSTADNVAEARNRRVEIVLEPMNG